VEITKFYKAEDGSIKASEICLGSNVMKVQQGDGHEVWATSPISYVKNGIAVVECLLNEEGKGYSLKNKAKNPFPSNHRLELDVTNELGVSLALYYMQLIGILRWAVELGCINIFYEVSILSQYQVNPHVGHLEVAYHIFLYMKKNLDWGRLAYDPATLNIDYSMYNDNDDWTSFYGNVKGELPPKMPKARGNPITISAFVDNNHAGNIVTPFPQ
jgi:hypothetical protein